MKMGKSDVGQKKYQELNNEPYNENEDDIIRKPTFSEKCGPRSTSFLSELSRRSLTSRV